jgi:hypothetical protein
VSLQRIRGCSRRVYQGSLMQYVDVSRASGACDDVLALSSLSLVQRIWLSPSQLPCTPASPRIGRIIKRQLQERRKLEKGHWRGSDWRRNW